jgi:leucyl-tRNA synthetase
MHLLYARFWTKVLHDAGLLAFDEPFTRLENQGMILDATGAKMSKSRPAHVVTPDDGVAEHGADALRAYILFVAPFDQDVAWSEDGLAGVGRWLRRVWRVARPRPDVGRSESGSTAVPPGTIGPPAGDAERRRPDAGRDRGGDAALVGGDRGGARALRRVTHRTIRDVTADLEAFRFNTVVPRLMGLTSALQEAAPELAGTPAWDEAVDALLRLSAPVTPHIAAELWARRGGAYPLQAQGWPAYDPALAAADEVEIAVQVNGVARHRVTVAADADEDAQRAAALASPVVARYLDGAAPARVIVVLGRVVNVVTG